MKIRVVAALHILVSLLLTVRISAIPSSSLTAVVSGRNPDTELPLLMEALDRQYTPRCLKVYLAVHEESGARNSSATPNPREAADNLFSLIPSKLSEKLQDGVLGSSKPDIKITTSPDTMHEVNRIISYINVNTERMTSLACVTYMLSRPPNAQLLSQLADPFSGIKLQRYFIVHARNSSDAERFLLDHLLRKEENVAALVQEESLSKSYWRVFIRQLYHPSGTSHVLSVNKWSVDSGLDNTNNIFPEQMKNFYGKKLTGVTLDHIPFSDFQRYEGSLYVTLKPCVNLYLLNTMSRKLNFTYEMTMPADGEWGFLNDQGHFVGVVGDVEFERANFAFDITVTRERTYLIDYTYYYHFDPLTFITAKSRPDPLWRKLITPFKTSVWVVMVISVGVGSVLYEIMYQAQARLATSPLPSNPAFMTIWAAFLTQSLHRYLWLLSGRVFLGFWFLYGFLVTSYYSTALTSTLAVPFAPPTIDTLDELFQSGLSFGMKTPKGSAYALFSSSNVPLYQTMFRQMTFHSTPENMRKVAHGDYSYVYFKSHVELLVAMHNNNPRRKTDIHIATETFFPTGNGCAVPKGAPYRRTFNAIIQKCLESGLVRKWMNDALPSFLEGPQDELYQDEPAEGEEEIKKEETGLTVLNLNHLQGPFFILVFGNGLGLIVLFGEIMVRRSR